MPVLTMEEIDVLRGEANRLIEDSRYIMSTEEWKNYRYTIEAIERQIDVALEERRRFPACPFCPGRLLPTPTVGRLECDTCRATALRGRR